MSSLDRYPKDYKLGSYHRQVYRLYKKSFQTNVYTQKDSKLTQYFKSNVVYTYNIRNNIF